MELGNLKFGFGVGATYMVLLTVESQKCGPKSATLILKVMKLSNHADLGVKLKVPTLPPEGLVTVYSLLGTVTLNLVLADTLETNQVVP